MSTSPPVCTECGQLIDLARWVKSTRAQRGWSIRELSARADVAPMTVQRIEKGKTVLPASLHAIITTLSEAAP